MIDLTQYCAGCGNHLPDPFFENNATPVDCGYAPFDRAEAINAKKGEIRLSSCANCGLVQNTRFEPSQIRFEPGYAVDLVHSPSFLQFLNDLADRLIQQFDLNNKQILEIGCGQGHFLKLLCQRGGNHGIGVDPTVAVEGPHDIPSGKAEFIRDCFPFPGFEQLQPDFICSLSVIEDIPKLQSFLSSIRLLSERKASPIYLEAFNGVGALERGEIWSIHYEQCNYFSAESLENILIANGFQVSASGTCYQGDQYVFAEAYTESTTQNQLSDVREPAKSIGKIQESFDKQLQEWDQRLSEATSSGKRVVLWGAGGKGISLLNCVKNANAISHVVDINPDRQQRFIPGTGHLIVAPEKIQEIRPDLIIVTNQIYLDEIKSIVESYQLDADFVVA